ncbi:MAG: hypothetical protein QG646_2403 [Euryarchaeota archaeon]|nr:hypothetical protein [Euryarchaeota archaeon]
MIFFADKVDLWKISSIFYKLNVVLEKSIYLFEPNVYKCGAHGSTEIE